MALVLYQRPSGIYHVRGTHHGIRVDQSARTRVLRDAEAVKERLERKIFDEVVLGKPQQRSFAEAAIGYMNAGGEKRYLAPILKAYVKGPDRKPVRFGAMLLNAIEQSVIDELAGVVMPTGKASTRNRCVYTPVAAVLNYAADQRSFAFNRIAIRRPKQQFVRPDHRTPLEVEWWLERTKHLTPLMTAYVGTGARASELLNLEWGDVSLRTTKITLWEDDTKTGNARGVDVQSRVRNVWPERGHGHVWRNLDGDPWHSYDAINLFLRKITEREAKRRADSIELAELKSLERACRRLVPGQRPNAAKRQLMEKIIETYRVPRLHLHALRHTWATWAYAVTRDLPWVMSQGGWATEQMALRYVHAASIDLADEVRDHGWTIREHSTPAGSWEKMGKSGGGAS